VLEILVWGFDALESNLGFIGFERLGRGEVEGLEERLGVFEYLGEGDFVGTGVSELEMDGVRGKGGVNINLSNLLRYIPKQAKLLKISINLYLLSFYLRPNHLPHNIFIQLCRCIHPHFI